MFRNLIKERLLEGYFYQGYDIPPYEEVIIYFKKIKLFNRFKLTPSNFK